MYTFALALLAVVAVPVAAQNPALIDQRFPWGHIPYMVDTSDGPRGIQTGYNLCNASTEGQTSRCQTALVNSLDDFCIWGPQKPDQSIADTEGELVAWCTKPGHGTRIIPPHALTAVQFIKTPDYLQVVGRINQSMINIAHGDSGGEEDPHGADGRGNPLGSLVYSNGFPSSGGNNNTYKQVIEWHNFLGGEVFCFKVCDPDGPNAANYCQHIYDRIGCQYNAPAAYKEGVFEKCLGDNQDFPGVYYGADGAVSTFYQPPESLGPITSMPYQPRIPASSSCTQYQSKDLYAAAASLFPDPTTSTSAPSQTSHAPSRTSSAGNAERTGNDAVGSSGGVRVWKVMSAMGAVVVGTLML